MTNPLSSKAVVADVVIRQWTGRKLDRKVTDEVNEERHAVADAGRYNKLLLPKEAFSEIHQLAGLARHKHLTMTMPWSDSGFRILPTEMYDDFANTFRTIKSDFNAAADAFAGSFPRWKAVRKKQLNGMFREEDYPSEDHVRGMFAIKVSIRPCPDVDDFRVKLAKEQVADIRSELEKEVQEALNTALLEPVRRVVTVVERMTERLKAYKPRTEKSRAQNTFRDSLVTNIEELLPLLSAFNLTGDKTLEALITRVKTELCANTADTLREDPRVRKRVAAAAEDILKQANALMA